MSAPRTRDERDRALARGEGDGLSRTCLVEAGAGTGKTTVLVSRFLALLGTGTDISRIVAITFTEKAAGELKVKLRVALEERVGKGDSTLAEPLLHIDRAVIGTIHSFCATLLRESPVEARVDPGFAVADGLSRTLLLTRTWDAWLDGELARGLPPALAEARSLGFTLEKARELADLLANNRDLMDHVPSARPQADPDRFAEELEREAADFLRLAREHCADEEDGGYRAIVKFADTVAAASYLSGAARISYLLKNVRPAPGSRQGNRTNWGADVLRSLRERAAALRDRQEELAAAASHNAAVALVGWLRGFIDRYEAAKIAAGVLDFDDLLLKARDLLRDSTEARERWKGAYDHILVDEFQDTDPLQCEVVFYLSESSGRPAGAWDGVRIEPGKLFIVGDPKQSIYRFRRADIEMYEHAKSVAGDVLHLTENFRTRPGLVAEVNAAFEGVMVPPEDGRKYQPGYEPLVPARGPDAAGPGLVILLPPGGAPAGGKVDEVRAEEARAVAAFIAEARGTDALSVWDRGADAWRPAGLGDIAILFRRTASLEAYEEALAAYDIDFRVAGGRRFYARREVLELSAVLTAVDDPHNGVAVVGALRSPFLGVSDESILLHRLKAGTLNYLDGRRGVPEVDSAFALLAGLHRSRSAARVSEVIRSVFSGDAGAGALPHEARRGAAPREPREGRRACRGHGEDRAHVARRVRAVAQGRLRAGPRGGRVAAVGGGRRLRAHAHHPQGQGPRVPRDGARRPLGGRHQGGRDGRGPRGRAHGVPDRRQRARPRDGRLRGTRRPREGEEARRAPEASLRGHDTGARRAHRPVVREGRRRGSVGASRPPRRRPRARGRACALAQRRARPLGRRVRRGRPRPRQAGQEAAQDRHGARGRDRGRVNARVRGASGLGSSPRRPPGEAPPAGGDQNALRGRRRGSGRAAGARGPRGRLRADASSGRSSTT